MTTLYLEIRKSPHKPKFSPSDMYRLGDGCSMVFFQRYPGSSPIKIKQKEKRGTFKVNCYHDSFSKTIQEIIELYINPEVLREDFFVTLGKVFNVEIPKWFEPPAKEEKNTPIPEIPEFPEPKKKRPRIKK